MPIVPISPTTRTHVVRDPLRKNDKPFKENFKKMGCVNRRERMYVRVSLKSWYEEPVAALSRSCIIRKNIPFGSLKATENPLFDDTQCGYPERSKSKTANVGCISYLIAEATHVPPTCPCRVDRLELNQMPVSIPFDNSRETPDCNACR